MVATKKLSLEDGNLSKVARVTSRSNPYKDIDLLFQPKRNGDIYKKTDASAVKQAVKNLILTNYYDKPFNPFFGGNIRSMLFELADATTGSEIEESVKLAISNFEPRARVLDVQANVAEGLNIISVRIIFQIVTTNEVVELETSISRLR